MSSSACSDALWLPFCLILLLCAASFPWISKLPDSKYLIGGVALEVHDVGAGEVPVGGGGGVLQVHREDEQLQRALAVLLPQPVVVGKRRVAAGAGLAARDSGAAAWWQFLELQSTNIGAAAWWQFLELQSTRHWCCCLAAIFQTILDSKRTSLILDHSAITPRGPKHCCLL